MRNFAALLCLALAACGDGGSSVAVQEPSAVIATLNDAITGCTRPLVDAVTIDQAGLVSAGWAVTERATHTAPADAPSTRTARAISDYPALRAGEYEATSWRHSGHAGTLYLTRNGPPTAVQSFDNCMIDARVANRVGQAPIIAALTRRFGRAPDRTGAVPRGGDFLTPRSDAQRTGHYWSLPQHDVFLETSPDGHVRINVVAMPDRAALDQFSPDRPENRVVILPGETN